MEGEVDKMEGRRAVGPVLIDENGRSQEADPKEFTSDLTLVVVALAAR